jgi:hypothetical protein
MSSPWLASSTQLIECELLAKPDRKPMRIAIDAHAALVPDRGSLGIGEPLVHRHAGGLAAAGQFDRLVRFQVPAVVQIQIRNIARQIRGVREARTLILGGVAGDGAGLLHGVAHRRGAQVPGTGRTLALAEVHRQPQAPIALVFHRVHLPEAHGGGEAALQTGIRLALRGTGTPGFRHDLLDDLGKFRDPGGVDFLLHMPCRFVGAEL